MMSVLEEGATSGDSRTCTKGELHTNQAMSKQADGRNNRSTNGLSVKEISAAKQLLDVRDPHLHTHTCERGPSPGIQGELFTGKPRANKKLDEHMNRSDGRLSEEDGTKLSD